MRLTVLAVCGLASPIFLIAQSRAELPFHPRIPKAWNDSDVSTYALPLSYGKPANYMSAEEYYRIPARTIFRTYPIYRPDREPPDYVKWLKEREPEIAFDAAKLKTKQDWI